MSTASAHRPSTSSRRRWLLAGALLPWFGSAGAAAIGKGDPVDWPALKLLDGRTLSAAHWQGHPAVVVFWSTDCAFCMRHNARLDKLYRQVQAAGGDLRMVAIATDRDPQVVRDYMRSRGYIFPVALEAGGIRSQLTARKLVPMTVLIGRDGRLHQVIPGELSEEDMLALARG